MIKKKGMNPALARITQIRKYNMLISAAAPVAMVCSMFGQVYGTDYLFSTRTVAVSTIFSSLTIPFIIALSSLFGG